jgi:hypothetical protein
VLQNQLLANLGLALTMVIVAIILYKKNLLGAIEDYCCSSGDNKMNEIELLFHAQSFWGFPIAGRFQPTQDDTLLDKFRLNESNGKFEPY